MVVSSGVGVQSIYHLFKVENVQYPAQLSSCWTRTPSIPLHPPISYMVLKINLGDCPLSLVNTFYPFRGPWSNTLQRPGLDYYLFIYWLDYLLLLHTHWSWAAGHWAGQKTRGQIRDNCDCVSPSLHHDAVSNGRLYRKYLSVSHSLPLSLH